MAKKETKVQHCPVCGRTIGLERQFYSSRSPLNSDNGKMKLCKRCVGDYFKKFFKESGYDVFKAIIATCAYFDIALNETNIPEHGKNLDVEEAYDVFKQFMKTNSGVNSTYVTRDDFDIVGLVKKAYLNTDIDDAEINQEDKLYIRGSKNKIDVDEDVILFFGEGYTETEYQQLLREYLKLSRAYGINTPTDEINFKEIAYYNMAINRAKISGAGTKEINDLVKARRDIMKDAGLQDKKNEGDAVKGLGSLIKEMEFSRPSADVLPEWDESVLHQLEVAIAGHAHMSNDITSDLTEEYEELMAPYSVEKEVGFHGDDGE